MALFFKKTPVVVSFDYPACPDCDAGRGDPCRTRTGNTRMPHAGRDRVALMDGIVPWQELCWEPARYRGATSKHPCRLRTGHSGECSPTAPSRVMNEG